jgi:hypothetical protein
MARVYARTAICIVTVDVRARNSKIRARAVSSTTHLRTLTILLLFTSTKVYMDFQTNHLLPAIRYLTKSEQLPRLRRDKPVRAIGRGETPSNCSGLRGPRRMHAIEKEGRNGDE